GRAAELKDGLMARLSEATGRTVIYNNLGQTVREPDLWKKHMARVEETSKAGIRAYPLCSPNRTTQSFTMRNCQTFRGAPTWHPILLSSDEEKLRAYGDPAKAARRGRRVQGRGPGRRVLPQMVRLHVARDTGAREKPESQRQDDPP